MTSHTGEVKVADQLAKASLMGPACSQKGVPLETTDFFPAAVPDDEITWTKV